MQWNSRYKFTNDINFHKTLDQAKIGVSCPSIPPCNETCSPIRRDWVKTFFNMLGPMVNPSFPKYQMVGVFNLNFEIIQHLYQKTDKIHHCPCFRWL